MMSVTPRYRTLLSGFVALLGIVCFTAESSAQTLNAKHAAAR